MSRADAVAALVGEGRGFVCGLSWLPPELLDAVSADTGSATRTEAAAAVAASIPVDLAFVAAGEPDAPDTVAALHAADVAAVWAVDGVFSRVARALGWTETLRLTAADPGDLAARLDRVLHDALDDVRAAFDAGADVMLIGDDLAGPSGPLMSPDYILDALVPCYRRMTLEAGAGGLQVLFHSDGEIRVLLPALARTGISGVHLAGLDSDAFAVSAASARHERLIVLGGISAQSLVGGACSAGEHASAVACSLGGVVVCDDGGITTFEELVAFSAAIDAARGTFRHPRA